MDSIFDSVLINRMIFDNNSNEVMLECTTFENRLNFESTYYLSNTELNILLCELSARGIELNLEDCMQTIPVSETECMYHVEMSDATSESVFLPAYIFGNQQRALSA